MNFKRTLITLVLLVVLIGLFKWDTASRKSKEEKEDLEGQLMQLEAAEIDRVTLTNANGEFELTKEDEEGSAEGVWRIHTPFETKADPNSVRSMLISLAGATKRNAFTLEGEASLKDFGLDDPEFQVKLESSSAGEMAELSVGDKGAAFSDYYARLRSEENEIFQINSSIRNALDKKFYDLRDKTVLTVAADGTTTISLRSEQMQLHAEKKDGVWRVDSPIHAFGGKSELEDMLREVNGAQAADFVDTTGTLQMAVYGLDDPEITLTVWGPEFDARRSLLIGDQQAEEDRYYAKRADEDQVFLIEQELFDELNKEFNDFRSKDVFHHNSSSLDIERMEIKSERGEFTLVKNEDLEWTLEGDSESVLDNIRVDDLAAAYVDLRIQEFLTDDPTTSDTLEYGFEKPALRVAMQSQGAASREEIEIGRIDFEERVLYARRPGSPSLFSIEWSDPTDLIKDKDDLIERKIAQAFSNTDVASIDIETIDNDTTSTIHFEKIESRWQGRAGKDGEMSAMSEIEVASFVNALTRLKYDTKYAAGSRAAEVELAADTEINLTVKDAEGKSLLDVEITQEQFDVRIFKESGDGAAYLIKSDQYEEFGDALERLLDLAASDDEDEA